MAFPLTPTRDCIANRKRTVDAGPSGSRTVPFRLARSAGEQLKARRTHLHMSAREVEKQSRRIVESENDEQFYVSNAWLTQIENGQSTPGVHKLFSLSVIYRLKFADILLLYGIDLQRISKLQLEMPLEATHLVHLEVCDSQRVMDFPTKFEPECKAEKTTLLSRIIDIWGEVPVSLIQHLDIRHSRYGFIGLADYTLYPLIRPGSFVQIDDTQRAIRKVPAQTEHDRPVYFVELRDGYACAWCELHGNVLMLLPHPLSPCSIRLFTYPRDAEIVGRVTAVATRISNQPELGLNATVESLAKPLRTK